MNAKKLVQRIERRISELEGLEKTLKTDAKVTKYKYWEWVAARKELEAVLTDLNIYIELSGEG